MAYNVTGLSNMTGVVDMFQKVNTHILDGWFGILILIMVYGISLWILIEMGLETKKAVSATAFIGFGVSLFLFGLDLVPMLVIVITVIMSAASLAMPHD